MPKMKSAMMFQPEDHVQSKHAPRLQSPFIKGLQIGGIFGSGCLMFVGEHCCSRDQTIGWPAGHFVCTVLFIRIRK
eukprot:SAG11_NODE_1916_length_4071_cov_3.418429_3_plen_76_part_00